MVQKLNWGGTKIEPNNIDNNIIYNIEDNINNNCCNKLQQQNLEKNLIKVVEYYLKIEIEKI